jgi:hypothetical protein
VSDLYLDLRRRIPVVTEWTTVGSKEMEDAQARTGLSDERLARMIPISSKTWTRWKKRGQIPTHLLPKVAPILGFELVTIEPLQIPVAGDQPVSEGTLVLTPALRESVAVLVELVQRLAETAERNEGALGRIEQAIHARAPARRRARPPRP